MEDLKNQPITIQEYRNRLKKLTCNISELAEMLGISKEKARRLTKIHDFPCIRIGRDTRIIISQLDPWLVENINKIL